MCLLVVLAQTHPDIPLIVGANRDELLDRPAVPMTVLRPAAPRVLGGRDELAGGTWLAVNDAGVVAGLTNRPTPGRRDPAKRSRGELPLALAGHRSAAAAVEAFGSAFRPADFNPSWLLVGDRDSLFAVDMTGSASDRAVIQPLPPGLHVLENRPLGAPSPKVDHVRRLVAAIDGVREGALAGRLRAVLADHELPVAVPEGPDDVPPNVRAACVHTEQYGTRWSCVVTVPADRSAPPSVSYADGPACGTAVVDAGPLWSSNPHAPTASGGLPARSVNQLGGG